SSDLLAKVAPTTRPWTKAVPLPGGEVPRGKRETGQAAFARWLRELILRHPDHDPALVTRIARTHGTAAEALLSAPLGENFGGLFEAELRRFVAREWALTGEDVLWRRTKMGLHLDADAHARVAAWMTAFTGR
ncbi:MAG: glycerol-3-phosphate dehydrogenase, partial [Candidatus Accumulibacter sp.]|nr:glycerol-3-phosphate dehydrogenase [Accumulibacter sp.]